MTVSNSFLTSLPKFIRVSVKWKISPMASAIWKRSWKASRLAVSTAKSSSAASFPTVSILTNISKTSSQKLVLMIASNSLSKCPAKPMTPFFFQSTPNFPSRITLAWFMPMTTKGEPKSTSTAKLSPPTSKNRPKRFRPNILTHPAQLILASCSYQPKVCMLKSCVFPAWATKFGKSSMSSLPRQVRCRLFFLV